MKGKNWLTKSYSTACLRIIGIAVVGFVIWASEAQAHKVQIFAYVEDGTVYTESYFSDGSPVQGGEIAVFDASGKCILKGKTDKSGMFSFTLPQNATSLKITIDAGMGHKSQYLLQKDDLQ